MSTTGRPPVVVVGVGSPMRGDDALGPRAIDLLGDRLAGRSDLDLVSLDGDAARLIEALRSREIGIVLDAVAAGAEPGTIHRVEPTSGVVPVPAAGASTHAGGVAEAVRLAAELDLLPARLVVLGIEPDSMELGQPLSRPVAAALPALVDLVVAELARIR